MEQIKNVIEEGRTALGIELGSTRIKAVLIDENNVPIATGSHTWENRLENNIWTYSLDDIWAGLKDCYRALASDVFEKYGVPLRRIGAMGISAMMHGYMVFGENGSMLTPFRTWRNTITGQAATELTEMFDFNIPQRWSIAHLYQAILNGEEHVKNINYLTTLAGYVHWRLTGKKVVGIGEASGIFPIDSVLADYDESMTDKFDGLVYDRNFTWKLRDLLPDVLAAGEPAGTLTEEGARLLDPSGNLLSGVPLCPPEGDAGTGMTATNSVAARTGNVSAGTSIFAMAVLERPLSRVYPEIDIVATPTGKPVAMVHCNNCASEIDAWVGLFEELTASLGVSADRFTIYDTLYNKALEGESDCGGLLVYNYHSGEHITGLEEGRPLFVRSPESRFTLANLSRSQLYSAMATLKIGMDILFDGEDVHLDKLTGHGGLFKTPIVGQRLMAAATGVPVTVMETAENGGAWGIALLAGFMISRDSGETLEDFLTHKVFSGNSGITIEPDAGDMSGFNAFLQRYKDGMAIERAAVEAL